MRLTSHVQAPFTIPYSTDFTSPFNACINDKYTRPPQQLATLCLTEQFELVSQRVYGYSCVHFARRTAVIFSLKGDMWTTLVK